LGWAGVAHHEPTGSRSRDIPGWDIPAWDIPGWDMSGWDIPAWDIRGWDMRGWDIPGLGSDGSGEVMGNGSDGQTTGRIDDGVGWATTPSSGRMVWVSNSVVSLGGRVSGWLFRNAPVCKAKLGFVNLWRLTC
jgi:hypothetical protein